MCSQRHNTGAFSFPVVSLFFIVSFFVSLIVARVLKVPATQDRCFFRLSSFISLIPRLLLRSFFVFLRGGGGYQKCRQVLLSFQLSLFASPFSGALQAIQLFPTGEPKQYKQFLLIVTIIRMFFPLSFNIKS